MGEAPHPVTQQAGKLQPAEVDDGRMSSDGRDVAQVAVVERLDGVPVEPRPDGQRRIPAGLLRRVADAGHGFAVRLQVAHRIADDEDIRAARHSQVRVDLDPPGAISLELDKPATQGQALVVSENYFPGWQATVNGTPAPTGIMNYNLIGVVLPQGAKSVELRFTDAAYLKGKRLTLVALVIAAAWLVAGLALDRRTARPSAAVPA